MGARTLRAQRLAIPVSIVIYLRIHTYYGWKMLNICQISSFPTSLVNKISSEGHFHL